MHIATFSFCFHYNIAIQFDWLIHLITVESPIPYPPIEDYDLFMTKRDNQSRFEPYAIHSRSSSSMMFSLSRLRSQLVLTSASKEGSEESKFKSYSVFQDVRKRLEAVNLFALFSSC